MSKLTKLYLILTVLLLIDCALGGFIAWWRGPFWSSVEQKQLSLFILYITEFSIVALISCYVSGKSGYIANIAALEIRDQLTNKALYSGSYKHIEGGAQRVQEDCFTYPKLLLQLLTGLIKSITTIVVFSAIIFIHLPWYYCLFPFVYSIIGTVIAGKIAFPLINLNYINQVLEAKFRQQIQVPVSFASPQVIYDSTYKEVHDNNQSLFVFTKYLTYFQSFYNQLTIIVPYVILSTLYFTTKISFGIFMQVASGMIEIINNMSYLINSFNDINKLLSCRKRLKESEII